MSTERCGIAETFGRGLAVGNALRFAFRTTWNDLLNGRLLETPGRDQMWIGCPPGPTMVSRYSWPKAVELIASKRQIVLILSYSLVT